MSGSRKPCHMCGSTHFGSGENADGTRSYLCHGYLPDGRRCNYQWHESENAAHFEPDDRPAGGGVLQTGRVT